MSRAVRAARRYWMVTLTLAIGAAGMVMAVAGAGAGVRWLFSGYALAVAAWQAAGMIRALRRGQFGLDILAITAIVATVLVGEYVAALIVVLMLTGGEALEDYADRRAKRELDALLARAPQRAHRAEGGAGYRDIPVDEVRVGDLLLVRPAEILPVDGVLVSPRATLDQSSITGESIPVERTSGDDVVSGAVNGTEAVEIRATRTAGASQYQQIVALVAGAAESKPSASRRCSCWRRRARCSSRRPWHSSAE